MTRAHFYETSIGVNSSGVEVPMANATVTVWQTGTVTPITQTMYQTATGGGVLSNPLTANASGEIDFWLPLNERVDLQIVKASYTTKIVTVEVGGAADPTVIRTGDLDVTLGDINVNAGDINTDLGNITAGGGGHLKVLSPTSDRGLIMEVTDDTATGVLIRTYHNTPSPAASDILAYWMVQGNDTNGTTTRYGDVQWRLVDPTAGSTGSALDMWIRIAGAERKVFVLDDVCATLTKTDDGATGPALLTDHVSTSPAVSDVIGAWDIYGRDSCGNQTQYGKISALIVDPTNGSEDGQLSLATMVAGTLTNVLTLGPIGMAVRVGGLDMTSLQITNIGAAGTDFSATGGLTLADQLILSPAAPVVLSHATATIDATNLTATVLMVARRTAANAGTAWAVQTYSGADALVERIVVNGGQNQGSGLILLADPINISATSSTNNQLWNAAQGAGTNAMYIGNAQITVASDMRLKRNIRDTERDALAIISQLRVRDYEWDDPSDRDNPHGKHSRGVWTGLVGQEMV